MGLTLGFFDQPPGAGGRTRAAALHHTLHTLNVDVVGWLDPAASTAEFTAALARAFEPKDVAAVALAGATLTVLGVPSVDHLTAHAGEPPKPVLFAPAGRAVYHRGRVLAAGGIDAALIDGHEDANLGWRLALRGFRTILLGDAAGLGGSAPLPPHDRDRQRAGDREPTATIESARRLRHQVANELSTLYLYAGDAWLKAALPCALARQIVLAAQAARLDPAQFDFGRTIPDRLSLPVESIARLLALDDFIRHLKALDRRRRSEQAARRRPDDDLRPMFAEDPVDRLWLDAAGEGARALCRIVGLGAETDARVRPRTPPGGSDRPPLQPGAAPRVSIVVLTALGAKHLPDCLDSIAALDYPRDAVELIVVDNASADEPSAVIARHYPGARVVRTDRNLGFCGGNNVGADAATHEWLFFLNDDTRVSPGLLRSAFDTAARRHAACVGAFTVSWDGSSVDYAGGGVNFEARGFQHGVGSTDLDRWRRERPVAFANGAAMLIRRDVYLAAGGFPDPYFAYYEDVALGCALWLIGHEVWLSPDAMVFHRHHGTSARSANAARQRNCERNAFFTVFTQASQADIGQRLTACLLLAAERVVLACGLGGQREDGLAVAGDHRLSRRDRWDPRRLAAHLRAELLRRGASRRRGIAGSLTHVGVGGLAGTLRSLSHVVRWGGPPPAPKPVSPATSYEIRAEWAATLAGTAEACRRVGEFEDRRSSLQAARQRDDQELATRFPDNWLNAVPVEPERQAEYDRAHAIVADRFV